MKNKVLLVLTGGTIGSEIKDNIINVEKEGKNSLLDIYKKHTNTEYEFDIVQPYNILSENLGCDEWNKLVECLRNVNQDNYDGIIITHGSDTLAYTSALVSFCFNDTRIPIILVASNYPLRHKLSNGIQNFTAAMNYIKDKNNPSGVFVIYMNNKQEKKVYLGTRILEADFYTDQFSSFNGIDFGLVAQGEFHLSKMNNIPTLEELNNRKCVNYSDIVLTNNIMLLTPYPGIDYNNIVLNDNIKAVFHYTYHSATLSRNVIEFIKRCKGRNIDFYVPIKDLSTRYDTSNEILKAGAIPLGVLSKEAGYVKLLLAYNQNNTSVMEFLKVNIFFENIV